MSIKIILFRKGAQLKIYDVWSDEISFSVEMFTIPIIIEYDMLIEFESLSSGVDPLWRNRIYDLNNNNKRNTMNSRVTLGNAREKRPKLAMTLNAKWINCCGRSRRPDTTINGRHSI